LKNQSISHFWQTLIADLETKKKKIYIPATEITLTTKENIILLF